MSDLAALRDYHSLSSAATEKDRTVELRRRVVQDLSQSVQLLRDECRRHEEQLQEELQRFSQRKALQDEKIAAKESQGHADRERVAALDAEETRLRGEIAAREAEMKRLRDELQQREALAERLCTAKEGLTQLKLQLEERDARVVRLETRIAKMEMAAEKRHAAIAERLPEFQLPRADAAGLEDTAGESILLIDEFN